MVQVCLHDTLWYDNNCENVNRLNI
jgi:hypothetical protein